MDQNIPSELADILNREAVKRNTGFPQAIDRVAVEVGRQLNALEKQVGGSHYKGMKIQPMEFSMINGLNACQHTAVKYIVRKKGDQAKRIEDLKKAIHTLEIYIEMIEKGDAE